MGELEAHPDSDDAISHLHKMSTTAGVGTQEYVAINTLSVVSILLGLASALAIITDSWVLLAIPVAAIVTAILALRQIGNSNGTQTGRAMAAGAVILALGLGATRVYLSYAEKARLEPDKQKVIDVVRQCGDTIKAGRYRDAYAKFFHASFKKRVSLQEFEMRWRKFQDGARPNLGELVSIESNGLVNVGVMGDTRLAETRAVLRFEKTEGNSKKTYIDHISVRFEGDEAGDLRIEDMPDLFPPPDPRGVAMPSGL